MSDGGYDSHQVAAIGGAGGGAPNTPQPGTFNGPVQLAAAILRINLASAPNTGVLGLQDCQGLMAKQFSVLGALPTGPCTAIAASLKKHFVSKDAMGDHTAGIVQANLEHAHISEDNLGRVSHGLHGGGGMSHVAALSHSSETELG